MNEVWKPIEGFEGLYEVSNCGRVRSPKCIRRASLDKDGYPRVTLKKHGKNYTYHVHRLVAKAFCHNPYPEKWNQVNHKDETHDNNRSDNLEWCDNSYNHAYGTCGKRANEKNAVPIIATVIETSEKEYYASMTEAAIVLGVNSGHICDAVNGKRRRAYGRAWEIDESRLLEKSEYSKTARRKLSQRP